MKTRKTFTIFSGIIDILVGLMYLTICGFTAYLLITSLIGSDIISSNNSGAVNVVLGLLLGPLVIFAIFIGLILLAIMLGVVAIGIIHIRYGIVSIKRANKPSEIFYPLRGGMISILVLEIICGIILALLITLLKLWNSPLFICYILLIIIGIVFKIVVLSVSKKEKTAYDTMVKNKTNDTLNATQKELLDNVKANLNNNPDIK